VDGFLKFCAAVSLLVAAASVGYYFSVYLPERDAKMDREKQFEQAKAEMARKSEQARLADEREAEIKRQSDAAEAKQFRYRVCIANAEDAYTKNWASSCRDAAQTATKKRTDCQKTSPNLNCDLIYPAADSGPSCTLSGGAVLNERLEKSRNRCLEESRSGVQ
jgi:Tfp pilus assembly protein PilX